MNTTTTREASTPLAELIGPNRTLHMRASDVHVLIDALRGDLHPADRATRQEVAQALVALTAMDDDVKAYLIEQVK